MDSSSAAGGLAGGAPEPLMSKETASSSGQEADRPVAAGRAPLFAALARLLTLQDTLLIGYLLIVWKLVWGSAPGPEQDFCARRVYVCIAVVLLGAWCGRGQSGL